MLTVPTDKDIVTLAKILLGEIHENTYPVFENCRIQIGIFEYTDKDRTNNLPTYDFPYIRGTTLNIVY